MEKRYYSFVGTYIFTYSGLGMLLLPLLGQYLDVNWIQWGSDWNHYRQQQQSEFAHLRSGAIDPTIAQIAAES